jgi:2-dehydropantoate 2-reductase
MSENNYKIGIIGLGPIGQTLSVHFEQAGLEVAVTDLDREKLNLVRKDGIELVGRIEKKSYLKYVCYSVEEILEYDFDILICAVKDYHVNQIIKTIEGNLKRDVVLLSAQNGIDIGKRYQSHFPESSILRMVINFAGNLQAPNVVGINFFNPPNYVGSLDDSKADLAQWIATNLNKVDLVTEQVNSFTLNDKVWEKTILNAALSPLCAISLLTMKEAMNDRDSLEIVEQILYEAVQVANAENIKLPDNFIKLAIRYLNSAGNHMPSLAIDLINKRETEIDFMNGKIVDYGRKHYIKTPINLVLTNLVNAISNKNGVVKC